MPITDAAKEITNLIYKGYGSSTGYLFGIPPELKPAVEAVVQCALEHSTEYLKVSKREEVKDGTV